MKTLSITEFGAIGDGKTMNTEAFAKLSKLSQKNDLYGDEQEGTDIIPHDVLKKQPAHIIKQQTPAQRKEKTFAIKDPAQDQPIPATHLFLLSKIKKEPVQGTSIVQISSTTDTHGNITTAFPIKMIVKNANFKPNTWYKINGYFEAQEKKSSYWGVVDTISLQECLNKNCRGE